MLPRHLLQFPEMLGLYHTCPDSLIMGCCHNNLLSLTSKTLLFCQSKTSLTSSSSTQISQYIFVFTNTLYHNFILCYLYGLLIPTSFAMLSLCLVCRSCSVCVWWMSKGRNTLPHSIFLCKFEDIIFSETVFLLLAWKEQFRTSF